MKIKNRETLLKLVAVLAVIILVGDQFVLQPLLAKWNETAEEIRTLEEKYNKGQSLVDRERSYRRSWRILQRDDLNENRSAAEQVVLEAVQKWREESRVKSSGSKPQWKEFDERYQTYNLRLSVEGSIREIAKFIHIVESDPLPMKVEELEIAARDKSGEDLSLSIHISGIQLGKSLQQ